MTKQEQQPVFVNLQSSKVRVFDEKHQPFDVFPYRQKGERPNALYEVHGEHYRQFVSGQGPLYPFPGSDAPVGASGAIPGILPATIMQADVDRAVCNLQAMSDAEQQQELVRLYNSNSPLFNAVAIDLTRIRAGISGLPARPVTKAPERPTAPLQGRVLKPGEQVIHEAEAAHGKADAPTPDADLGDGFNPFVLKLIEDISPELEDKPEQRLPMAQYVQARLMGAIPMLPAEYTQYQSALDLLVVVETEHKIVVENYDDVKEQLLAVANEDPAAINASKNAFTFAQEHSIDLTGVEGTGLNGQVTVKDVRGVLAAANAQL